MKTEAERPVIVIALITAVCMLGDAMLYIVLPVYWQSFGLTSLWQVGVLLSVNRLVRLPLNPVVGWLYHKISKRMGMLIAVILAVITTFSYGFLNGFWILVIMRSLWGVSWSFLRLGGFLTILEVADEQNRGFLIGKYNGLFGLGALFGMLAGGTFADLIGVLSVAVIFSIIALISLPFVIRYVPATVSVSEKSNHSRLRLFMEATRQKDLVLVMVTGLIMSSVFFGILMSTISHLIDEKFEPLHVFGIAIGAASLAGIIQAIRFSWDPFLAPRFGRLSDGTVGRVPFLTSALFIGAIAFAILPFDIPFYIWVLVLLCLQMTSTMIITLTDSLASDVATTSHKVAIITAYTVIVDVGAAIGPSFGYLISDLFNMSVLYWVTAGLLLCLALIWIVRGLYFNQTFMRKGNKELSN